MQWILIIIVFASASTGTTTAEFNSKEFCLKASEEILGTRGIPRQIKTWCVPKGEE